MALTENDLIDALHHCASADCRGCPRFDNGINDVWNCRLDLIKQCLPLIDHQKAEIERLQEIIGAFPKVNMQDCNFVRAEAIKEFAKRSASALRPICYNIDQSHLMSETLYDLVKEMVGDV